MLQDAARQLANLEKAQNLRGSGSVELRPAKPGHEGVSAYTIQLAMQAPLPTRQLDVTYHFLTLPTSTCTKSDAR
jgi:hypothetical protein